ncbi:Hypothetical protein AT6N2_L0950 [Agrobacterium tumefaciens]|nr:Hypothetical protein AT6N2_L0950 [Agrobacterium tumefaciens]
MFHTTLAAPQFLSFEGCVTTTHAERKPRVLPLSGAAKPRSAETYKRRALANK